MKPEETIIDVNQMQIVLNNFIGNILAPEGIEPPLVVGSLALRMLLGTDTIKPKDIDIEVRCLPEQEKVFKILSRASENDFYTLKNAFEYGCETPRCSPENRMGKVTWTHKPYIFTYRGVVFNVWCVSEYSHEYLDFGDASFKISTVMSVMEKKVAYRRLKDHTLCTALSAKFMCFAQECLEKNQFPNK